MNTKVKTAISPTRQEDYPEWFQQIIKAADLAEHSAVRGCMVIKPWGYALWDNMRKVLDSMFKAKGSQNAYFPLFIPMSYLEREAQHVEGFAKECAVVTHSRLQAKEGGGLEPGSPLEEPLVVRPTSEMIIGESFSKWIQSYRDLPLKINQWANIVRWEMRTRLFLRTAEILWQEGHTAHATREEAFQMARDMLDVYVKFAREYLGLAVVPGVKSPFERFPGAEETFTFEAMMQDRKALQAGTSHFLGQNFAKAMNISFVDEDATEKHVWTTSWGVTTRLIGALAMTHGDDDGLIMPPRIASQHVVILPIVHKEETRAAVMAYCQSLMEELQAKHFNGQPIEVSIDERDMRGGDKMWQWIKKGIPMWVEVGPRDMESSSVFVGRRDQGPKARESMPKAQLVETISSELQAMQDRLLAKAEAFRQENTVKIDTKSDLYDFFTPKNKEKPEIHGGFAMAHWSGDPEVEDQLQKDLKVTLRCIPLEGEREEGKCVITSKPSKQRVVFAKAY